VDFTASFLDETVAAFLAFRDDPGYRRALEQMADTLVERFRAGQKLMICGNGGSAADAQHIAAEFVSRLLIDRAPLPALALTTDSSNLTAIGNDYGYEKVFERQVLALGQEGDVLLGISTSGTSKNVLRAFEAARSKGVTCFAFAGANPGPMRALCSAVFAAPSAKTAIIQQIHITAAHLVCGRVEQVMFPPGWDAVAPTPALAGSAPCAAAAAPRPERARPWAG